MDDTHLADLLGPAPRTPDPGFRIDVFARIAARAQRRAALRRGAMQIAVFAGIGALVQLAQTAGLRVDAASPVLMAALALVLAGLMASALIAGPRQALQRSLAAAQGKLRF